MSFYIQKIYAYGSGKKTSVIDLDKGLNIIYGPSNTGKTYIINVIDYLFGGKTNPIDILSGYDTVAMDIVEENGYTINLKRKLDSTKIKIETNHPDIESKEYTTKKAGNILLSLIGIDDIPQIISSQEYKSQNLTWRTILNMFLIDENRISSNNSIITSLSFKNITAALSSLLYLINGEEQNIPNDHESGAIKKAKREAVTKYIKKHIISLTERNDKLQEELKLNKANDIDAEIERLLQEISETDEKISSSMKKSKKLLKDIYDLSAKIEEAEFLKDRYAALESQYVSDIKRLEFIINGEQKQVFNTKNEKCPFCDSAIKPHPHHSYTKASQAELDRIKMMLADLKEIIEAITEELNGYKDNLKLYETENNEILNLIELELKPYTDELKKSLASYQSKQQLIKEIEVIKSVADNMNADMFEVEHEEDSEIKYNPKNHFERDTIDEINKYLDEMLRESAFPEYLTSRVDLGTFDVITNARKKSVEGQGFKSFINTIFAFVLMKYLTLEGKYAPKLLIIDSPIMALTERESNNSNGMKAALFEYLVKNNNYGQVIIAENEIPNINYKDTKLIEFSGLKDKGRCGFLINPN